MIVTPQKKLWDFIFSTPGRLLWLGDTKDFSLKPKSTYTTNDGISGEIRTVKSGERIRLTYQLPSWKQPSTLQITLSCPRNSKEKTNLNFHQEKLKDAKTREQMRKQWKEVTNQLTNILEE
jgi:uncharacterized protein YndB with AHSA1/START domain